MKGLSILIPVYEYNPTKLIKDLIQQSLQIEIPLEIILIDDASSIDFFSNWATPFQDYTTIQITRLNQNIGRAAIRNNLIQKASFDWLLFLDADTIPCTHHSFPSCQQTIPAYVAAPLIEKNNQKHLEDYAGNMEKRVKKSLQPFEIKIRSVHLRLTIY
jgi:hypothetical protein